MDENIATLLQDLGFNHNETKVFLSLLKLGPAPVTKIAKGADLHRANTYDALNKLLTRGVVAYILKENTKYYQITNVENLLNVLKEKELRLQEFLPQLSLYQKQNQKQDRAMVLEGMSGLKTLTDDMLILEKPIYVFGVPKQASEIMKGFIDLFHKRRIKKKMWMYHIYNEDSQERIASLNNLPYTEAVYLPREYDSPATTVIYGEKVAFVIWSEPAIILIVESERMAKAYTKYFSLLILAILFINILSSFLKAITSPILGFINK